MRKLFLILFLSFPFVAHAQRYTRAQIHHRADSCMQAYLGDRFTKFLECKLNSDKPSYYRYTDEENKMRYAELPLDDARWTKGYFEDIKVWYRFRMPYPKCPMCDPVIGKTYVQLDWNLDMVAYPDIGFIPDYVWANDSCRLTSLR